VKVSTLTDKSVYPKRKERQLETEASFFLRSIVYSLSLLNKTFFISDIKKIAWVNITSSIINVIILPIPNR